MSNYWLIESL